MAKSKKTRKQYRPRIVEGAAGINLLNMRTPMHESQQLDLGIAYHVAYDEMINGRGSEEHWSTLAVSMNIALTLAECGHERESLQVIKDALDGMHRANLRGHATGNWGFDGDALNDMRAALHIHERQIQVATKAAVIAAQQEVHRRISAGEFKKEAV